MNIPITDLKSKLLKLVGLNISLAWKGYGSAIFLELGNLTKEETTRSHNAIGEACIWLEWDWRVEKNGRIQFGSSNNSPEIEKGITHLVGLKIEKIEINGEVPELTVSLSNGYRIQTMAMVTGDPRWAIRQTDSTYLSWENSNAVENRGDEAGPEDTIEERAYINLTEEIAERLGRPCEEPVAGNCGNCGFFFHIDGDFSLLDYGLCLNKSSKFDQHAVRTDSGCPVFLEA